MLIKLSPTLSVDPDKVTGISEEIMPNNKGFNVFIWWGRTTKVTIPVLRDYFFIEAMIDKYTWLINNRVDWNSREAMVRIARIQSQREKEERSLL